jgi:DNA-binding response OmpR family regulator
VTDVRAIIAERDALRYLLDEMTAVPPDLPAVPVRLRPTERRILGAMLRNPGAVFDRAQLTAAGKVDTPLADWGDMATVSVHIHTLRRKLAGIVEIQTHHGIGYSATMKRENHA